MTELIMLIGLPACGKSTFAQEMVSEEYHWHSSDNLRAELGLRDASPADNNRLFTELHRRIRNDLRNGISCIYDATNLTRKNRMSFLNEIQTIACRKTCCLFLVHVDECKRRNALRGHSVPEFVYDKMLARFEPPFYKEGWDDIQIRTSGELNEFDPESMIGFQQDNPHHNLDLYGHTMCVLNNVREMAPGNEILAKAALYHDIGKMCTKKFTDRDGNPTKEAHYFGHAGYGAYMFLESEAAKGALRDEEFLRQDLYIASLIAQHMSPFFWGEHTNTVRKKLGEKMFKDILVLHSADIKK